MTFMALIPAWAWRWIAIAAVAAAAGGWCFIEGVRHEEKIFDDYKEQVKLAGDKQNFLTQETIKAHKALQEISDAEAKTRSAERDAALLRVRILVQAGRDSRIVPAPAAGAAGSNRICFAAEQLDRGLREALGRVQDRTLALAQAGQRGVDTAVVCRDWASALAAKAAEPAANH